MKEESISLLRCKSALLNLPCSYGDACRFVHDDAELTRRQDLLREKRAQKARLARGICYKFSTDAACIYGDSCRFAHVEADIASAYVAKVGKRRERLQQRRAEYEAHSATDASSRVDGENRLELEMRACPLYGDHKQLFEEAIHVMSRWRERFHDRPDIWMRFTKRTEQQTSRLVKEFCEAAPVIARVRACVRAIEPKEPPVTIVDLCSGFGFISMFLSEMLPASRVHRILLIDKRWSFTALQRDMHSGETVSVGEGEGEAAEDVDGRASANYISVDHITGIACSTAFNSAQVK